MISAIVAADDNWGIGRGNKLLAHIPEDMKFFKEKTMNNVVIMGRKTYESLPKKPLPNRTNIVITSKETHFKEDDTMFVSMDFIKAYLKTLSDDAPINYYIIGGGTIYRELLPYCECAYVTKIFNSYDNVDTFFPNIDDMPEWGIEQTSEIKEHNDIYYQFCTYKKKEV